MPVKRSDAVVLMKDIYTCAQEANAKHANKIEDNRKVTLWLNILIVVVNTLLGSTLWANFARDVPVVWVKYTGLTLSIIASLASGVAVALALTEQIKRSLRATKTYTDVVYRATRFRMSLPLEDPLAPSSEEELFEIYQMHNKTASEYGDRVATLKGSTWSAARPSSPPPARPSSLPTGEPSSQTSPSGERPPLSP